MADRTIEELLQAPTEGYGEAIVISEILAKNFEIKTNLLQLVQTNKFHGFERNNPHTHISNFKRMTSTLKYRDVPNDAIKLMLFRYSLEGAARIWYEKEPPNSILTWDDLVNKFVNQFFPPSKTTHLKNEISRFTQRFEETFGEAWERFKERACPHHRFLKLTQINTFYNGLNEQDQDSLNAAAGGNLLSKTTREALKIIENKSKVRYSRCESNVSRVNTNSRESSSKTDDRIDKLADQILNLVEIVNLRDVPNDAIKLMLFPYSLEGAAKIWYEKEPPNSILTWDDLVNKFVNPPSKTTHLKNEISRFTQRFEETFGEAWERFKEMLRACPHHGFSELTQIDTFYNGLNKQDQDSLNAAAGRNLLSKTTREALKIIENKSKVRYSRGKSNVSRRFVNKQVIAPATVKAVEKYCVICGGAHDYYDCIATDSNQSSVCAATGTYNQVSPPNRASNQMAPPGFAPVQNNQNRGDFNKQDDNLRRNLNNDMRSILGSFFQNQASTSGTLPSNTIPNPKGEMKAVTTRSGLAYEGPSIPTNSSHEKVVEQETEDTTDKEQPNCQGSTAHIQHLIVPTLIPELDVPKTQPKPNIPYPSRLNDQRLRAKAKNQMEKFFQIFHDLHFDISFVDALLLMLKFSSTIKSLLTNKDKLFKLAKVPLNENFSAMLLKKLPEKLGDPGKFLIPCDFSGMDVCHALADLGASINLMPLSIWKKLSLP
nr:reverse transcriptase domain-containing protein [Tanacetum cinerariifolium]